MKNKVAKNVFVHIWDWKEQPNFNEIQSSVNELDGKPTFTEVQTGSDEYAVIISTSDISESDAKRFYKKRCNQ